MSIISIQDLDFGYTKDQLILKKLCLEVKPASIYGFLGTNGAGKSTTIRSLLGLLKPKGGAIRLFEQSIKEHKNEVLGRVGALIESPSLYHHLSGYDNLRIAAKYFDVPRNRVNMVLQLVNLEHAKDKNSGAYSTGMKQRLGLAIALLTDPELLILDEPTNGLDPGGIIEMRETLQRLHQNGKTIFLSSHLLSEIEKLATQVGILRDGKMVFEGTIEELEQLKQRNVKLSMMVSDAAKAVELLNGAYKTTVINSDHLEIEVQDREEVPELLHLFMTNGHKVYEVCPTRNNLEDLFLDLTLN